MRALLEEVFPEKDDLRAWELRLREMARQGSSPYSMWRDIAYIHTDYIAVSCLHGSCACARAS